MFSGFVIGEVAVQFGHFGWTPLSITGYDSGQDEAVTGVRRPLTITADHGQADGVTDGSQLLLYSAAPTDIIHIDIVPTRPDTDPTLFVIHHRQAEGPRQPIETLLVPEAVAKEAPELLPESRPEEIIWHDVRGRVEHYQERGDLVQRVQRQRLEVVRIVFERPDHPRHQGRHLADKEDDDDAN